MDKEIVYVNGSKNVFADLGVRDPSESRVRAELAKQIAELIARKGLRQTDMAKRLGVDQSKVSKLVRGRISGFTSDRLLRFLEALGCHIRIEVKPPREPVSERKGKVVVVGV